MPTDRSRNLETLFTWNGENTTESVGYEMKKKNKKKTKKSPNAAIPKTTGCVHYSGIFLPGNNW